MEQFKKYIERLPGELDDPCVDLLPVHIGPAPALSSPRTRGGAGGRGDGRGGRGSLQKIYIVDIKIFISTKIIATELVTGEPPDTVDMVSERRLRGITAKMLGDFQFHFTPVDTCPRLGKQVV